MTMIATSTVPQGRKMFKSLLRFRCAQHFPCLSRNSSLEYQDLQLLKSNIGPNRWYRGDSGDAMTRIEVTHGNNDAISEREAKLLQIAQPKYQSIYERHIKLPSVDGLSAMTLYGKERSPDDTSTKKEEDLNIRRKRLIYRSKQRGWLEVDLLLGTWSDRFVPEMSEEELDEFERFVNLETIDIFNVLTLRSNLEHLNDDTLSRVVNKLQEWAKSSPLGKAEPHAYASAKLQHRLT